LTIRVVFFERDVRRPFFERDVRILSLSFVSIQIAADED